MSSSVGRDYNSFHGTRSGGRFRHAYWLLNLRTLKISMLYENNVFQYVGMIFCVEF